jgi:hypothetical protein
MTAPCQKISVLAIAGSAANVLSGEEAKWLDQARPGTS